MTSQVVCSERFESSKNEQCVGPACGPQRIDLALAAPFNHLFCQLSFIQSRPVCQFPFCEYLPLLKSRHKEEIADGAAIETSQYLPHALLLLFVLYANFI